MTDSLSVTQHRDEGSAGDAHWRPALVILAVAAFCACAWAASIGLAALLFLVIAGGWNG